MRFTACACRALGPLQLWGRGTWTRAPKDLTNTMCPVAHTLCSVFSTLSYYVQGLVTVQGPVKKLASHIVDPSNVNGFMYHGSVAMFATSPTHSPLTV